MCLILWQVTFIAVVGCHGMLKTIQYLNSHIFSFCIILGINNY